MFTARNKGRFAVMATAVGAALALAGCASGDPLDPDEGSGGGSGDSETIVIGSQGYYSNEIIAEIYAQALEDAGFTVERNFNIGQRDAILPSLESGELDLIPEYTGNLLQYYNADATATQPDEVYSELVDALPDGLTALDYSPATDQDSYNVTQAFSDENGVTSLADLAGKTGLKLGGPPEMAERPYGPSGLESVYGVTVEFQPTADTTVDALVAGTIDIGNVYSADPRIASQKLVTLEDPEGLFLSSNVVPIANADIADDISDIINAISAAMTPEDLVALNVKSVDDEESSDVIATDWLTEKGLLS